MPEMVTLFNVSGALLYCDENGDVTRAEHVFDKLAMSNTHTSAWGWGRERDRRSVSELCRRYV